jgi:CheY-like chemotaxis protein
MDIQMPGMDGTEALRWFRRGPGDRFAFVTPPATPVVAVTANALDGDAERFLALGFDDYLSKPLRHSQLHDMLTRRLPPRAAAADDREPGGAPAPADPYAALAGALDADALERLRELDPGDKNGLLPRVLQAFETSIERLLGQLADARRDDDIAGMRHVAHTLKSSAASIGALELSRICADIERRIREQRTEGLGTLLDDMVAQSDRVRAVLKPVLRSAP